MKQRWIAAARVSGGLALLALIGMSALVSAQANTDPPAGMCIAAESVTSAAAACANMDADQVCLGAGDVSANGTSVTGATLDLAEVDAVTGGSDALAVIHLQADLPVDADPVRMVLFGGATITNALETAAEPAPTITVINKSGNVLNLRDQPDLNGAVVGTMSWSAELTANGRSSDGEWLHVQRDNGDGWVYASLVTPAEGDDAGALAVLDSPITQPMQSLTLTGADGGCGGLLVQSTSRADVHLEINGALITLTNGALLAQTSSDGFVVQVIAGSADVLANGVKVAADAGEGVTVPLTDGAAGAPAAQDRYAFTALASAPLDLLAPEALTCVAGVVGGSASLYSTPGAAQAASEIDADTNLTVTGQITLNDGSAWWFVNRTGWVAQADVITAGACADVPQVAANAAQQQAPANVSLPAQPPLSGQSLVPPGQTIWTAHTGPDNLTGTCSLPPIAQCDHLAAVIPNGDGTITWRGQEPVSYTLYPSGENTYTGSLNANGAHLTVTVTFTSPSTWIGSKITVYDSDPNCTHTFSYTAELR